MSAPILPRFLVRFALGAAVVLATSTCGPRRTLVAPRVASAPPATTGATIDARPTDPPPSAPPTDAGGLEDACVAGINAYRATLRLPPLVRRSSAESCADAEALSDSKTGEAHGAFGKCDEMAQNECPGWPGPPTAMIADCLKMMWAEGPGGGHYENMRGGYTQVWCGFTTLADGSVWSVQDFR